MFHTILTLSYTIPNIYLFVRIWQLFIRKEQRVYYVLIYLALFLVYPVSNLFREGGTALSAIANYLLPFFLYVFLFVLLLDLLLLLNMLFRVIPREKIKSKSFRNIGLPVIILCSLVVVAAGIINFNTIRRTEYQVTIPAGSSDMSHLKIAFASDFHLEENTPVRFVERFVKEIETINPDLMLFGGDIVEGDREDERMEHFEKLLGSITARFGVFGVLGNHEYYARQDKGSFFVRAGIDILRDSAVFIDGSFILAGRNDSHTTTRKSVEEIMRIIPDSLPVILVDHRPTEIDQISKTSANIVLSGHTHNGQLFPVNFITRSVYELSYGYMKKGDAHFFVSSGIRLWGFPVRTAGKSEIMVINVNLVKN
jgi:predicted MPP superfamily phosphohydrolase